MFRQPSPERIAHLTKLPALEAVRLILAGDFTAGEDEYLLKAIRNGAEVNCDEEELWEILYEGMEQDLDPATVLGRLVML